MWYMRLRESPEDSKFEAFLKVGNNLGGLYSRVQQKKFEGDESVEIEKERIRELQIKGISKLPMEIEAVNRVGCEFLKPELLDNTIMNEVIVEQYDSKTKAAII